MRDKARIRGVRDCGPIERQPLRSSGQETAITRIFAGMAAGLSLVAGAWAQTPRPGLVVLNKDDSELVVVDPGTLKITGRVKTGPIPHEVAVSDDGKIAVATNYGAHQDGTTLSVIDLDAMKEIQRVELGQVSGPHGIAYVDGKFYFTAEHSNGFAPCPTSCTTLNRYDPAKKKVEWTGPVGQERTHMVVAMPGGREFYLTNVNSGTVSAIQLDGEDGLHQTLIHVGKGPEGIDISPNAKEVWAANSGDGTVSVIDTATKKVVATIDVGTKHSNRLKFTRDGKLALISDLGSGDLVVVDAATRREVKRLKLGKSCEGILMAPDGLKAYVAVSGDDKVDMVDLKKLEVAASVETGKDPDGMGWRK